MKYKVENQQELVKAIQAGVVVGCGHCDGEFDDESDYAFAMETGECIFCKSVLGEVLTHYVEECKGQSYLIDTENIYEGKLEANGNRVSGHKVLKKGSYEFQGLLSCDKVVLWSVDEDSVKLMNVQDGSTLSWDDFLESFGYRAVKGKELKEAMHKIHYMGPEVSSMTTLVVQEMLSQYTQGKYALSDDKFYKVVEKEDGIKVYKVESSAADVDELCTWSTDVDGINWYTECGHTHFPYIKTINQPKIVDDVCPWCNKKIEYDETNCNDEDDE